MSSKKAATQTKALHQTKEEEERPVIIQMVQTAAKTESAAAAAEKILLGPYWMCKSLAVAGFFSLPPNSSITFHLMMY